MILSRRDAPSDIVAAHGGSSVVQWTRLATGGMLHSDIESFEWNRVPAGAVIGEHVHTHTEEVYCIISGNGEMRLGDGSRPVGPGDPINTDLDAGTSHTFDASEAEICLFAVEGSGSIVMGDNDAPVDTAAAMHLASDAAASVTGPGLDVDGGFTAI